MLVAAWLVPGAAAAAEASAPAVTVAVVPPSTTPAELGRVPGMALGLMSAGIGPVPPAQTYLDASQGNRVDPHLYGSALPPIHLGRAGADLAVPASAWRRVRSRAAAVPADLVPGLVGSTLRARGVATRAAADAGDAALVGVDRRGRIGLARRRCEAGCPGLTVVDESPAGLRALAAGLRDRDLLIALAAPPPGPDRELAVGISGAGFAGRLTSESTHTDGLIASTDLAPTILARLGAPVPGAVAGQAITSAGAPDAAGLERLGARLAEVPEHRPQTITVSMLAWAALALAAGLARGRRGLRTSLPLLACTVLYLPALLLLTAALEPSQAAETVIVALGAPALAVPTVALAGRWGALAIAGAISVGGYAIDVVAGSGLSSLSLIGPNPVGGTRFYGIGNELEAFAAAVVPIAVGSALEAWRPRARPRTAALAFAVSALLAIAAFAPGRFGADVGAAVDLAVGGAVAAIVCLGARRRRAALIVVAVPVAALAALAVVDLVSGGDAHLTRSVLDAGGLGDLGQVAERRLRLSAHNFAGYVSSPVLWAAVAILLAGVVWRRPIAAWFAPRRYARAGFLGALAGAGTAVLVNDSGGLVLMITTAVLMLAAGVAWSTRSVIAPRPSVT